MWLMNCVTTPITRSASKPKAHRSVSERLESQTTIFTFGYLLMGVLHAGAPGYPDLDIARQVIAPRTKVREKRLKAIAPCED